MSQPSAPDCPRCGQPLPLVGSGRVGVCRTCAAEAVLAPTTVDLEDQGDWLEELPPDTAALSGRRLGNYQVQVELGRGGMGVVYLARQDNPVRNVVLKVLRAGEAATPAMRVRFHAEAEAISSLDHPHILPVYEAAEANGDSFIAMKWAEGGSLAKRVGEYAGRPREAAKLLVAIAMAVRHAHRRGILHRDLKPANILLDADSQPFVADFGIAKWLGRESAATLLEGALGTPSYMSPEQAGGQSVLTVATDVYSLGTILYELLAQRAPFVGATPLETMQLVTTEEPVPPSDLQPGVPRDLETICLKCLAKEPSQRYASAGELAADLERWLEGRPITARPVPAAERAWLWVRRNRLVATLAALSLGLLLAVAIGSTVAARRLLRAEAEKTEQLRAALLTQARATQSSGLIGQRFDSLEALRRAAAIRPGLDLRDAALRALTLPDVRRGPEVAVRHGLNSPVAFNSSLSQMVVESEAGLLTLRRADGTELRRYEAPEARPRAIYIAPLSADDSKFAVRFSDDRVRVYAVEQTAPLFELTGRPVCRVNEAFAYDFAFSPDGRELAVGRPEGGISLHDATTGRETGRIDCGFVPCVLVFSPDGKGLALAPLRGTRMQVFDRATGQAGRAFDVPATILHAAWRPDGTQLAIACFDNRLYLWETGRDAPATVLRGHVSAPALMAWSPDGHWLASSSRDGSIRLWDADDGTCSLIVWGAFGEPCLRFSRDVRHLAVCSEGLSVAVFKLGLGDVRQELLRTIPGDYFTVRSCLDFSSDGRLMASAARSGVRLFDARSGRQLALLPGPANEVRAVKFTPAADVLIYTEEKIGTWRRTLKWAGDELEVGPPVMIDARTGFNVSDAAGDPPVIALYSDRPPLVSLIPVTGGSPLHDFPMQSEPSSALSPDGKFLATADREGEVADAADCYVWEVATGRLVRRLGLGPNGSVRFTPDGAWLWASGGDQTFCFHWPSLERRQGVKHSAFDFFFPRADRSLVALADEERMRLIDGASGETLGHVPGARIIAAAFSNDGRKFVQYMNFRIYSWDLPTVRRELDALGLDWKAPAYPPLRGARGGTDEVKVVVK